MRLSSGTCSSAASTSRRRSSRRCSFPSRTPTTTSTTPWRQSLTSSTLELWDVIVDEAARESPLWADPARADAEREPVFSTLCDERFAPAVEPIYECYLCHYGRSRLSHPPHARLPLLP